MAKRTRKTKPTRKSLRPDVAQSLAGFRAAQKRKQSAFRKTNAVIRNLNKLKLLGVNKDGRPGAKPNTSQRGAGKNTPRVKTPTPSVRIKDGRATVGSVVYYPGSRFVGAYRVLKIAKTDYGWGLSVTPIATGPFGSRIHEKYYAARNPKHRLASKRGAKFKAKAKRLTTSMSATDLFPTPALALKHLADNLTRRILGACSDISRWHVALADVRANIEMLERKPQAKLKRE